MAASQQPVAPPTGWAARQHFPTMQWMPPRLLMLLCLLMLCAATARGANEDAPRFVSIGAGGGLPNGVVSSLAEDREGFVWFGTAAGAVRFDGHRFRLYGNRWSAPQGETSLFVRSLLAAAEGGLWVGTDFAGLARYEPAQDRLAPVSLGSLLPPAYSVNALAETADGRLWIGTDGQGLVVRAADGAVQRYSREDAAGLGDNRIDSLLVDRHGTLWVGTWRGLQRLPAGATAFAPVGGDAAISSARITALFAAGDGQIWIGSRAGQLWRIAADGTQPRPVPMDATDDAAGSGAVHALLQADPGTLWVARANGIEIRAAADGGLRQRLRHQPAQPESLASNEVRALLRDRGGQFWVGGYGGGVQRHNPLNVAFRQRDRHALNAAGAELDDPNVRAVAALRDGRILLGSHDRGIGVLDAELRPLGLLRDADGEPLLRGVRITGLAETADGALWIGSDAGLFRRAGEGAALQPFALGSGRVRRLLADPRGDLWIAAEDGLLRHTPGASTLQRKHSDGGAPLQGDINALGLDPAGRLWVGGDLGLGVLADPDGALRWIAAAHPARGHNPDVLGLLVDAQGAVWFDTPSGLFRLRIGADGHEQVDAISLQYGAPGRPFGANLLQDAQGRLWTQTHVLDPALGRMLALGPADGVDVGSAWFRAYAQTADGRLLFGGTGGLLVVQPERYRFPDYDPPLVITELRIDGKPAPGQRTVQGLRLAPGQRSVAIEFSALDYSAPERTRYTYRLVGDDDDWREADASYRVATFANLAPGDYRFELRGSDRHGRFGAHTLVLPLQVLPAWWQTWWARLGALLLLALAFQLLLQQRTRWLRARSRELEHRVEARTRELQAVSTALQEKSHALEEASLTDPLTGLRNRRYFAAHIEADVANTLQRHTAAAAEQRPASHADLVFFLIDIDHFKQVNDEFGHAAGDAVLMQVAERLRACFRDTDHLVRWGGEEFLVVSRGSERKLAATLAARAVAAISGYAFELPDRRRLRRSCSLGYAVFPLQTAFPHQVGWTETIDLADLALYAAKRAGRDGWVGIESAADEPLAPGWLRRLPTELDAGRLRLTGSQPADAVRRALAEGGG